MPIGLEPGLFEWLAWYPDVLPEWLSAQELKAANYNINTNYEPKLTPDILQAELKENFQEFYQRNHHVTEAILSSTSKFYFSI